MREQLRAYQFQPNAQRVEPAVLGSIMTADGWLALTSGREYRLFSGDDVRKIMNSGALEAIMAEYVESWGRWVSVPHLGVVQDQVMPKGGWWWDSLSHITEHDLHLVRAIIGMGLEAPLRAGDALHLFNLVNSPPPLSPVPQPTFAGESSSPT